MKKFYLVTAVLTNLILIAEAVFVYYTIIVYWDRAPEKVQIIFAVLGVAQTWLTCGSLVGFWYTFLRPNA